jgi:hypothetical protein
MYKGNRFIASVILTGFSLGATLSFIFGFIRCVYGGMTRSVVFVGPDKLCEIPWMRYTIMAIAVGVIFGICFNEMEKVERKKGKKISAIPRIKFKNFATAILFFTTLFFGFIFIFVIREYNEYAMQATYMFRKTFWQYCATAIPWLEIVVTSLLFGIILTLGFGEKSDNNTSQGQ